MKLTRQDWLTLRFPLMMLGIVLILITVLVSYAEERRNAAQQGLQAQQGQLSQARQRYQSSGQEKDTIVQYLPRYQQLIKDGFIGEERRIEWVDSLRTIHQQQRLFSITYTIGQQQVYKPEFAVDPGTFQLERSVMKIELPMLHEGDLLALLQSLQQTQHTPVLPRQCDITRLAPVLGKALTPNFQASCELDWLTLKESSQVGIPTP